MIDKIGNSLSFQGDHMGKQIENIDPSNDIGLFIRNNKSSNLNTIVREEFVPYEPVEMAKKFR